MKFVLLVALIAVAIYFTIRVIDCDGFYADRAPNAADGVSLRRQCRALRVMADHL